MESGMTKAEVLKRVILSQYKSVRQFAVEMDIPYSTLVTALERGIEGMAYSTVIRICDALSLNPVDFTPLDEGEGLSSQITNKRVRLKCIPGRTEKMTCVLDRTGFETAGLSGCSRMLFREHQDRFLKEG